MAYTVMEQLANRLEALCRLRVETLGKCDQLKQEEKELVSDIGAFEKALEVEKRWGFRLRKEQHDG